jgi:hypothetical protein
METTPVYQPIPAYRTDYCNQSQINQAIQRYWKENSEAIRNLAPCEKDYTPWQRDEGNRSYLPPYFFWDICSADPQITFPFLATLDLMHELSGHLRHAIGLEQIPVFGKPLVKNPGESLPALLPSTSKSRGNNASEARENDVEFEKICQILYSRNPQLTIALAEEERLGICNELLEYEWFQLLNGIEEEYGFESETVNKAYWEVWQRLRTMCEVDKDEAAFFDDPPKHADSEIRQLLEGQPIPAFRQDYCSQAQIDEVLGKLWAEHANSIVDLARWEKQEYPTCREFEFRREIRRIAVVLKEEITPGMEFRYPDLAMLDLLHETSRRVRAALSLPPFPIRGKPLVNNPADPLPELISLPVLGGQDFRSEVPIGQDMADRYCAAFYEADPALTIAISEQIRLSIDNPYVEMAKRELMDRLKVEQSVEKTHGFNDELVQRLCVMCDIDVNKPMFG